MATKTKPAPAQPTAGEINNLLDLDAALKELGGLDARQSALQAQCDQELAAVKSRYQGLMTVVVNGTQHALDARRADLAATVEAYCEAHKAELLGNGAKSVRLTHGEVGWKASARTLAFIAGKESLWTKCVDAAKAAINSALTRAKAVGAFPLLHALRVKLELDKPSVMKAYNTTQLTDRDLKQMGLEVTAATDAFWLKPCAIPVENHAEN